VLREYGFSVEEVCRRAQALLDSARAGEEGTTPVRNSESLAEAAFHGEPANRTQA
jgi:hypothetical protein